MHDKMQDILAMRHSQPRFSFKGLLQNATGRSEMIAFFLAVLELMKMSKIRVSQRQLFNDIDIEFI